MKSYQHILFVSVLLLITTKLFLVDSKFEKLPIFQITTQKQLSATTTTSTTTVTVTTTSNYPTKNKKNKLTIFQTQPQKKLPIITTTMISTFCPYGTGINGSSCTC